jgi:hypothetical protein
MMGAIFESIRHSEKWLTGLFTALGSFIFSMFFAYGVVSFPKNRTVKN